MNLTQKKYTLKRIEQIRDEGLAKIAAKRNNNPHAQQVGDLEDRIDGVWARAHNPRPLSPKKLKEAINAAIDRNHPDFRSYRAEVKLTELIECGEPGELRTLAWALAREEKADGAYKRRVKAAEGALRTCVMSAQDTVMLGGEGAKALEGLRTTIVDLLVDLES